MLLPMSKTADDATQSWQQRAIDRSLKAARDEALARTSRFLAVAMELLEETGGIDFTVQDVVERSDLNLRSFYKYFGGKQDLIFALFESLMAQFVEGIEVEVSKIDDPFERLETYIRTFFARVQLSRPVGGRTLTIYNVSLAIERPSDFVRAAEPQVRVLERIVQDGVDKGVFRNDLRPAAMAHLINSTLVAIAQTEVFDTQSADGAVTPDQVWEWCKTAVTPS